jgi:hypothetical protein
MGIIRDKVEFWWNNTLDQETICKKHLPYANYTLLEYYDKEYLWIKARYDFPMDIRKLRKLKLQKLNENRR